MEVLDTLVVGISTAGFNTTFWIGVGILAGIYTIVALGLQMNVGFTGMDNFGMAGFMAVGAYAMAILTVDQDLSFWLALPLSMIITMLFGLLVGLPSLRLRSDYFAIATIASAELIRLVAQNAQGLTGGNQGIFCSDDFSVCYDDSWVKISDTINGWFTDFGVTDPPSSLPLLVVVWIAAAILTVILARVQNTPWGRVLRAVREDEDAARALGKNTVGYKLQSLVIASAVASIAGWFLALNLATIHPTDYEPIVTFFAYSVLVLGGLANYWGVALGSIFFWTLVEGTRTLELFESESQQVALRLFVAGIVLIGIMVFRPQGAFGKREEMVLGD